ncbi:UDP-2,3-diacylglucosamine hydrolase [Allopseudospirillum japonicum]|uniref:UDP-2,3-diacylglucosamine hydrolase n=1 Tax=Allopseudospirillum japonicum TaxID=64971 RepID=A0A1H6Q1S0_9GAMM|nr:UDP-2,3-diacylglucosamine diphosphatase [Allopseudospirillum japonicum]SEI37791.1 UDP-2,3-diacylglucosamine hydrolase [Allopseudospirillum japonicum]
MSIHLFISDLHLRPERPEIAHALVSFLQQEARHAQHLYLLGDIFEYWIGDDYIPKEVQACLDAFAQVAATGTKIYFMAGNRDFLFGEQAAQQAGMHKIPDPYVIDLNGTPVLLAHGDSLCTQDQAYQAFRAQVRHPAWQAQILALPVQERLALAQKLRMQSQADTQMKTEAIMDVTPEEVPKLMQANGVNILIHGHTHRPQMHDLGTQGQRWVLGDWDTHLWFIRATCAQDMALINRPLTA